MRESKKKQLINQGYAYNKQTPKVIMMPLILLKVRKKPDENLYEYLLIHDTSAKSLAWIKKNIYLFSPGSWIIIMIVILIICNFRTRSLLLLFGSHTWWKLNTVFRFSCLRLSVSYNGSIIAPNELKKYEERCRFLFSELVLCGLSYFWMSLHFNVRHKNDLMILLMDADTKIRMEFEQ